MIIILKQHADQQAVKDLCRELEGRGLSIHESQGAETHILGLVGDTNPSPRAGCGPARWWRTCAG